MGGLNNKGLLYAFRFVIPDGSPWRADPGSRYPSIMTWAPQGYLSPGARALRRSAGMTTERTVDVIWDRRGLKMKVGSTVYRKARAWQPEPGPAKTPFRRCGGFRPRICCAARGRESAARAHRQAAPASQGAPAMH